jgi:hypothetical protein
MRSHKQKKTANKPSFFFVLFLSVLTVSVNGVIMYVTQCKGVNNMKLKGAAIGTVATVAALGVIGSFGGNDVATDISDSDTDTYAIVETVDTYTESVIETLDSVITTAEIVTEPPVIVTEPPKPETSSPVVTAAPAQVLNILSVTNPVECGAMATLTAKGKPGVEYDIDVIYKKTESKAKGLENKKAASDGTVSWTWKVGSGTTPGTYTITVNGGGETDKIQFTVYE